jgi:peptide/nickel transport system substrate-binding protein
MTPKRQYCPMAVTLLLLSLVAWPGPEAMAQRTDVLVIAKNLADVKTPDPGRSYEISSVLLQFPEYSRLVKQRAPNYWDVQPDLAESWTVSPDASTYTFKLRKDAVFASGNPVTAEDIRFTLLRTKHIKGFGAFLAEPIKTVEVVDPQTVRVLLNGPDASFLAALAASVFSILDSKTLRAQGGVETPGADTQDKAENWFYSNSAGSGPYVLQRYTREAEIVLKRNDRYFGAKPFFREVIIRHVKEPSVQALQLERGDVDIALDLNVDQVERLKGKPAIRLVQNPSAYTVYLGLNTSVPPWNNPKAREAAKYAIDYDGIVSEINRGYGQRIGSIMMPGMLGFPPALNTALLYPQDLAKARGLMKEAGVTNASVSLTWPAGASYATLPVDRLAQKLRADLSRINLDLKLEPVQESTYLAYFRASKPQTVLAFWFPDFLDSDNWTILVNGFINKRFHWDHPEGAKVVARARETADSTQRAALYEQYNRILAAGEAPYIFLSQPMNVTGLRDNIIDFRYHPIFFVEIESLRRN